MPPSFRTISHASAFSDRLPPTRPIAFLFRQKAGERREGQARGEARRGLAEARRRSAEGALRLDGEERPGDQEGGHRVQRGKCDRACAVRAR
eukprot:4427794-Pleurochrysis_carterae.AAC.1